MPRVVWKRHPGHLRVWDRLQPVLWLCGLLVTFWGPKLWCLLVGAVALFRFAACMSVDGARSSR
jgi:hypothetical protein